MPLAERLPKITRAMAALGEATLLVLRAGLAGVMPPLHRPEFLRETAKIGVHSLVLVLFTGFFTGMVLALQLSVQLEVFGATSLVAAFVSTSTLSPADTGSRRRSRCCRWGSNRGPGHRHGNRGSSRRHRGRSHRGYYRLRQEPGGV
ncbi:MAG: hypothetical protein KatS3mg131_1756 [Candidatus Tectimicrobiota bacterium]|nr:MAG: hypothetical protein KatS3mg131_1756 [Candidatus Tectomicrobia bacterium]